MKQVVKNGFEIVIEPSDAANALGERNYGGEIKVYRNGELVDEAWLVISRNGSVRLERG